MNKWLSDRFAGRAKWSSLTLIGKWRRPAGDLATGEANTQLVPAEASSRVQLYVKTDWGPR